MGSPLIPVETIARIRRLRDAGYSPTAIGIRVGRSRSTVCKVIARGCQPRAAAPIPPVPGDFGLYAPDETLRQLQVRYRRGAIIIKAWVEQKGIVRPDRRHRNTFRPVPADFAARAPRMTLDEQRIAWRVSRRTLTRWRQECGLPTPRADLIANRRADAARAARAAALKRTILGAECRA